MGDKQTLLKTKSMRIDDTTSAAVLDNVKVGDTITNYQGITGFVFAVHKKENCGMMEYVFCFDSGAPYTEYSFNKRPL